MRGALSLAALVAVLVIGVVALRPEAWDAAVPVEPETVEGPTEGASPVVTVETVPAEEPDADATATAGDAAGTVPVETDEADATDAAPADATAPGGEATEGGAIVAASAETAAGDPVDAILAIAGDAEYGEYLASECTGCHRDGAEDIPSLDGLGTEDVVYALHAYRVGEREHQVMQMVASRLGDEEIAALAAHIGRTE